MYVRGYLKGSENGRVVTIASCPHRKHNSPLLACLLSIFMTPLRHSSIYIYIENSSSRTETKRHRVQQPSISSLRNEWNYYGSGFYCI